MKYIIIILAILISFLIACNEDPLGLEENVNEKIINDNNVNPKDTSSKDTVIIIKPDTRVSTDSVTITFSEYIYRTMPIDTITQRWTPLIIQAKAIIDTSGDDSINNLQIVTQRDLTDEINPIRKEYILAFSLDIDSLELNKNYKFNKINRNYYSLLKVLDIKEKRIISNFGDYPFIINFKKSEVDNKIVGEFIIEVPINVPMNHYKYFFHGEIQIIYE